MKKTGIVAIILMGIIAIGAALYLGMSFTAQTMATFSESGYVLVPEALNSDAKQQNFVAGTTYKSGTGDVFVFQNDLGEEVTVTEDTFLHYTDGSISSMAQGVIAKMDEIENVGFMNYYALSPQTILRASADGYSVDNQGVALEFTDFIWKISDNKFMIVSDSVDVHFSADDVRTVSGFVEVSYVDDSVVRIQTEENLWQTISPNCYATLSDGKMVNFNNRLVADSSGNSIFHLTNMVINADDNIPIYNQAEMEAQELKMPEFDIKVEDGADGVAGLEGSSGDIGLDGEEGNKGDEGDDGEQGDDGDEGDSGSAGSSGSSGSSGSDGSTGSTGGAAGSTGDGTESDDEEDESAIPVFELSDWLVSSDSVSCYIAAVANSDSLIEVDASVIYIYDSSTSKVIYSEEVDFSEDIFDDQLPSVTSGISLEPDKQYRLVVYGSYTDGGKVYQKDFISKTFYTDSSGIDFAGMYSTQDSLTFEVSKEDFSTVDKAVLYVFESETKASAFDDPDDKDTYVFSEEVAAFEELQTLDLTAYYTDDVVLSDRTYYFRMVCTTDDRQDILMSQVYSMKTLKQEVTIDKTPTVIETKSTYSFDVYPSITDPDNAVTKCTYYVYDANDTDNVLFTMVQYNSDMASIPVTSSGLSANTEYVIKMDVEYYDNEKTVVLTSDFSNSVSMIGGEMPTVSFAFNTDADTGLATGTNASTTGTVATSAYHETIDGTIYLANSIGGNGSNTTAQIKVTESQPVVVSISAAGVYNNVITYGPDSLIDYDSSDDTIEVPIYLLSLQQGTSYTFSVSAYVDFNDGEDVKAVTLGSFVVQTPAAATVQATMTSNATGSDNFGVYIVLSDYQADSEDASSVVSAEYSMQTAEMLEITLYSSDKQTIIGTPYVIWDDSTSDDANYDTSLRDSSFADEYYNKSFYVNQDDFNGNLTSDGYWVEITKFYDYTYETVYTAGSDLGVEYIDTFVNEIPLSGTTSVYVRVTDQPPAVPESPGGGVNTTEIMNMDVADYGGTYDESLPDETIVGYVLSSTYDDSSALGINIKYYAFENNSYEDFTASGNSYSGDIYNWSLTDLYDFGAIQDPITSGLALYETPDISIVNQKVPEVVLLFGALPEGESQGALAPSSGTATRYIYYTGEFVSDGNVGVTTADSGVSRGMQLQFAYTVGLNTNAGNTAEDYYPYCVWTSATQDFTTTSYVKDVPKAEPLLYAYPWAARSAYYAGETLATWRYWAHDPDDSVVETGTGSGKAHWLRDGYTYGVNYGVTLPGSVRLNGATTDMTGTEFATYEYGEAGANATMTISSSSSVPGTTDFGYVAIPLDNSGTTIQMSIEVELYLKEIYGDDLSALDTHYCETGSDGNVLTKLPVFRVYNTMESLSGVASLSNPVWDLDSANNTYEINFNSIFGNLSDDDTSAAAQLYDRLAGVLVRFTPETGSVLNLYKTLNSINVVSGKTSELATVVGDNVEITMYYLYTNSNIGFYNVTSGTHGYALQQFGTHGEPIYRSFDGAATYMISGTDGLKASTETAPAMGSFFTNGASYLTLGSSANMSVYSKELGTYITNYAASNHVNMDYDESYANDFVMPTALSAYGPITLKASESIDHTTPLIYFDTTNDAISELNTITMNNITFSGATSDNIGSYVYFKVDYAYNSANYGKGVPGYENMQSLYLSSGTDGTYNITFNNLEINEKYYVTVYAYQDKGAVSEETKVQLLDGTKDSTPAAGYYLNTLQEVEITLTSNTPKYIVSSYWDKYVQVNYSLSTTSGFSITYTLYAGDEDDIFDADGKIKDGVTYYYQREETAAVLSTNGIELDFGPYGEIYSSAGVEEEDHLQLPSGTYTLVIEATSNTVTDDSGNVTGGESLGIVAQEFEVENYASPTAIVLPTASVTSSVDATTGETIYTHGATIATIIQDEGCQLTAGLVAEYEAGVTPYGDYVVYVYEAGTENVVYTGTVESTYGANYFYPTGLDPETTYDVVVYAIKDANEDGKDDVTGVDLLTLRTYVAGGYIEDWRHIMVDSTSTTELPDYLFYQTTQFTTKANTMVVYDTTAFALKSGDVGIRFTGASGLNGGFDKIYYSVYYVDADGKGQIARNTITNPTFTLESSSSNTYWLELTEVSNISSSTYFQITVSYDYEDELDDEYDGTWSYTGYLYS